VALLLTATIDPMGMTHLARGDPGVRETDYRTALERWLRHGDWPIVFCENSGHDLSGIERVARACPNREVELLQFRGQTFPRHLGKGYGDLLIIRHALEHSRILRSADAVLKVTGRYYVENARAIVDGMRRNPDVDATVNLKRGLTYADSRVFGFRAPFVTQYLAAYQDHIDDSRGFHLEVALARAVLQALADGRRWAPLPVFPRIVGVYGTSNTPYRRIPGRWLLSEGIHRLKNYLMRR
jgi:hypothetical protein